MIVMMTAITPSLNASIRLFVMPSPVVIADVTGLRPLA